MSLEKEFLNELIDAIKNDRLTLPTLPEVALRIREAVEDPEVSAESLAGVIAEDAALAARIIKVANSPLMRGAVVVDNLQLGITRMGISFVRNLATGLAMEQMFQATHDAIDVRLRRSLGAHSLEVASISAVLASHFTKLKQDQAMLAGLVHEIGILPILTYGRRQSGNLAHEALLDKIIMRLNGKVGRAILRAWEFPEELRGVPSGCVDYERTHDGPPDYIDVVTVAKCQAYREGENPHPMPANGIPAFKKLGLDDQVDVSTVEELSEELDVARSALA